MKKLLLIFGAMGSVFHAAGQTNSVYDGAIVIGDRAEELSQIAHREQARYQINLEDILYPEDPQQFPPGMLDTLIKYDWVKVASVWFKELNEPGDINVIEHQTFFTRYFEDGSSKDYYTIARSPYYDAYMRLNNGGTTDPPVTVGEARGYTWLFYDKAKNDALRLVSYKNGLLMIDCSYSNAGFFDVNYYRRFRDVYIKVPKLHFPEIRK